MSWRAISSELEESYGVKKPAGNLWRWFQSQRKRALKLKSELEPFEVLSAGQPLKVRKNEQPLKTPIASEALKAARTSQPVRAKVFSMEDADISPE